MEVNFLTEELCSLMRRDFNRTQSFSYPCHMILGLSTSEACILTGVSRNFKGNHRVFLSRS